MKKNIKSDIIKTIKIFSLLLVVGILLSGCSPIIPQLLGGDDITEMNPSKLVGVVENAIDILYKGAAGVAGLFFTVGGIQYLTSYGDREKMEKAKKTIMWAIIGGTVIVLASLILRYVLSQILSVGTITY